MLGDNLLHRDDVPLVPDEILRVSPAFVVLRRISWLFLFKPSCEFVQAFFGGFYVRLEGNQLFDNLFEVEA